MKLHNIRYGFATNSSSSHSVVLAPGLSDRDNDDGLGFGWGHFILASPEAKRRYMFVAAKLHHEKTLGLSEAVVLANAAFPVIEEDRESACRDEYSAYIDHQSVPSFPSPRIKEDGMAPLWSLLDKEIVRADKVAIVGGNDNEDDDWKPPVALYAPEIAIYRDLTNAAGAVYSIDADSGHLTLFDKSSGKKIRILPEGVGAPLCSAAPELVDIKITDYCPVGCTYCYQGSTKKGAHANTDLIERFAYGLGRMGVFEVAIGGGDPTTHPDFARILKTFHDVGVVPNFSTQLWDWLDKPEIVAAVKSYCGAVALSTQNPDLANKWIDTCGKIGIKPHIHYVLGLSPLSNLEKMLKSRSNGHLVLLAFKAMGRAEGRSPVDYTGWQDVVRNNAGSRMVGWTVAVDSFLVNEVRDGFSREEVPSHLFEASDGKFSFYWDAVEGTYAAHSFVPRSERLFYGPESASRLREAWEKISGAKNPRSLLV